MEGWQPDSVESLEQYLTPKLRSSVNYRPNWKVLYPRPAPKAFANPRHAGYGGGPWPFDINKAYKDSYYRSGIRKALDASWTASNWKFEARRLLVVILSDLEFFADPSSYT